MLVISVLWLIKTYIHRMKKKRVLEVFIVETKGGLMFSHKDISGKTTLYDSYKLTTITELGGIDTKQPDMLKLKKPKATTSAKTEIELCEMTLAHYREYFLNKLGTEIISQKRDVNPNRKIKFQSILKCSPENKTAATKIIKQALLDNKRLNVTWLN